MRKYDPSTAHLAIMSARCKALKGPKAPHERGFGIIVEEMAERI
jgi:hypothetical protein